MVVSGAGDTCIVDIEIKGYKMPMFRVYMTWKAKGYVDIRAQSEKDAEDWVLNGGYPPDKIVEYNDPEIEDVAKMVNEFDRMGG